MPKHIFTQADIAAWLRDLDTKVPPSATEMEWPSFPDVLSFRAQALSAGATIRFQTRNGQVMDIRMNPVAARELAAWILHAGAHAGWLDKSANVVSPDADFDA